MKKFERKRNRVSVAVKSDIEESGRIVREDVYDILRDCETEAAAQDTLKKFLKTLDVAKLGYKKNINDIYFAIARDLKSYGFNWKV